MNSLELVQGTIEWKQARCGSLGASRLADAVAKTKSGWGASRANVMAELLIERLTGSPAEGYMNDAMRWGVEHEAEARAAYEFMTDNTVVEVGLVQHPTIKGSHASPDGLIGDDGMLEIKCPQTSTHIETLLGASIADRYVKQAQWQLACTGRQWVDFVSYDPRLPVSMRLFIKRIPRDNGKIAELTGDVKAFLAELDAKLSELIARYETKAAAA